MTASRLAIVPLTALLLSAAAGAQAQVAAPAPAAPEGKPARAWSRALDAAIKPRPVGVSIAIAVTESVVQKETIADFVQAAYADAPRLNDVRSEHLLGASSWSFVWRLVAQPVARRCEFHDVTIRINMSIDVAMLPPALASDPDAQASWQAYANERYASALRQLEVIRDGAKAVRERQRFLNSDSCNDLMYKGDEVGRQGLAQIAATLAARGTAVGTLPDPTRP